MCVGSLSSTSSTDAHLKVFEVDAIDCWDGEARSFVFWSAAFLREWEMFCRVDFRFVFCLVGFLEDEAAMVAMTKG